VLKGSLAAAVTPLRAGGSELDEDAVAPYVEFLAEHGLDGIFALGTTGEGILLSVAERKRAAGLFLAAASGRLPVIVHCGAQSTADTVELARDAAEAGADGVAVVGPPYFAFDDEALLAHFEAAALACSPVPFFVYEFAARSGYPIPVAVVERLRERAPNLAGLKVSDKPFDAVAPYLLDGLAVFVGGEPLLVEALPRGAAGTVSALAAAFPEPVARLARNPSEEALTLVVNLRARVERFPVNAALKAALGWRGLPVGPDVRAPLRTLSPGEQVELLEGLTSVFGEQ
jgi:dihydrodipicolinate synthase/N-acetylneuraminate lyase